MVSGSRSPVARNSAVTLPAVAASVCPAAVPSVQVVWARPAGLVTADAGVTEPPPDVTANRTRTSPAGCPLASVTRTTAATGSASPMKPAWRSPATFSTACGSWATVTWILELSVPEVAVTVAVPAATALATPLPKSTMTVPGRSLVHATLWPDTVAP